MKKALLILISSLIISNSTFAQNESPYHTSFKKDGIAIAAGVGLSALGLTLIKNKKDLTEAEVNSLRKEDVFFLDRFTAGDYSDKANDDSYIPFYASFAAAPLAMLINKNERNHGGQVMALFVETMSVTGAVFSITAGTVQRSRPYVYNTSRPMSHRMDSDSQRSFFAGHTAATATATFFAAKVFSDFNPDSKLKPYVWAAAAIVPASVGYMRLKAGRHFLTDNLLGYAIGAGAGILVPQLHKKENSAFQLNPVMGMNYKGLQMQYTFSK